MSTPASGVAASGAIRAPGAAAPLWAVLAFSALNSLGTGMITNGIYFLTKHVHGFGPRDNLLLGAVLGASYIVGSLGVAHAVRAAAARLSWLSSRTTLGAVLALIGLVCAVPALTASLGAGRSPGIPAPWTPWVVASVFGALSGAMWPLVESFLSGGRRHHALRRAVGAFNLTWALFVAVAFWIMPFFIGAPGGDGDAGDPSSAVHLLTLIGAVHIATIGLLPWFGAEPGPHPEDVHPHPKVYERLLAAAQFQLALSYVVLSALGPLLPWILGELGLDGSGRLGPLTLGWEALVASIWMTSRVVCFALMSVWTSWHGRWAVPFAGMALLAAGFAGAVASPLIAGGAMDAARLVLLLSLAGFGVGMGLIYFAALYYALEVGTSGVDAGGHHEALIGSGYFLGPAIGLGVALLFEPGGTGFAGLTIGVLVAMTLAVGVRTVSLARRADGPQNPARSDSDA